MPQPAAPNRSCPALLAPLLLILAVAFLPLAGVVVWDLRHDAKAFELDERQAAQAMANGLASELDAVLTSARQTLAYLARQDAGGQLATSICDEFASYGQVYRRLFKTILVVRTDGGLICSWPAQADQPVSFADRTWFKDAMLSTKWVVSAPMFGRLTGKWLIVIAIPVLDDQGQRSGVLAVTIELERLQEALQKHTTAPGAVASVFDHQDQLLTRLPWLDNAMDRKPLPLPAASAASEGELDTMVGLDSTPRVWASAALDGATWRVYAGLPTAPIHERVQAAAKRRLGLVLGLGLLASVVTWGVGRRLRRGCA